MVDRRAISGRSQRPFLALRRKPASKCGRSTKGSSKLFFGAAIGMISCYKGFNCGSGASGVGRACTESFVASFICIIIMNFFFAEISHDWYVALYGIQSVFRNLKGCANFTGHTDIMALIELRTSSNASAGCEVLNDVGPRYRRRQMPGHPRRQRQRQKRDAQAHRRAA